VLQGARGLLDAGVLGMQIESNFSVSPQYPSSHFGTIAGLALDSHLLVFDIAFDRISRASFQSALIRKGLKPNSLRKNLETEPMFSQVRVEFWRWIELWSLRSAVDYAATSLGMRIRL
jgi:hypothetical protein